MADIDEIDGELKADPSELRERIVREVGSFTVALLGVTASGSQEKLKFAGTGTLVTDRISHYILTASHVWEEILSESAGVGITLKEGVDHKFVMPRDAIIDAGPIGPKPWDEWGPDLNFLRVPPEFLGTINAVKVFYPLDGFTQIKVEKEIRAIELHLLMGTPKEKGQYTETFADLQIIGMFQNISKSHEKDDWDYLDLDMDLSLVNVPQHFGGVSGGGLWEILVYRRPGSSKTSWTATLEGVAFWQFSPKNHHSIVRCHGIKSIRNAFPIS